MSCTLDEIAAKKRIAQERLKQARLQQQQVKNTSQIAPPAATKPTASNTNGNSATRFLSTSSTFYGHNNNQSPSNTSITAKPNNVSVESAGKIRTTPNSELSHRHQPYPKQAPKGAQPNQLAPVFTKRTTAICSMISADRFTVAVTFNQQMMDVFKTIPTRNYDGVTKNWNFHIQHYHLLCERLRPLSSHVTLQPLPEFIQKLFCPTSATPTTSSANISSTFLMSVLEPRISSALMPFQKLGVCFGVEKQGRCMIADEMGLGKTYQALALADFYKNDWPLLVCTTASTRAVWSTTVHTLMPYVPQHRVVCVSTRLEETDLDEVRVLILSYSMMERNHAMLLRRSYPFVILDESHMLKNGKAKQTQAVLELTKRAKRVVLLTGTPALSRPVELFTQLQMLDARFVSFKEFTTRYCAGHQTNFGWDASGQSNLVELNAMLSRKFMIRRTKQQVLFELGEKTRETVLLDRSLIQFDGAMGDNMEAYATDMNRLNGRQREEVLLRYYQETALAKTKAVCAYLEGVVRNGADEKFIVFAHHRTLMDSIVELMTQLEVKFVRIDGRTQCDARTKFVDRFQNEGDCRVAVLSLKACNAGITLTAAQLVLFAELDWNPSTLAQAESRAHRIGQTGTVRCRYLIAPGTADDFIWAKLKSKQETLSKAGLCEDNVVNGTVANAPQSSGNIAKYLERSCSTKEATVESAEDFSEFFQDDDDADLAGIDFG